MHTISPRACKLDLSHAEYFSATTDCWCNRGMKLYISYYIDSKWAIKIYCLQTLHVPEPHTANNRLESLQETL